MNPVSIQREIVDNIGRVILGKRREIELALVTLICGGHLLIEDVPGVGKTSLAQALARSLACSFQRIQFTPDILPSDITGFSVPDPKTGDFTYRPGAVMANVVLADEINRASPKTQSSLLEAMEERQVTVDGVSRKIDPPFMVLATQNPQEYLGTYPLPEAQMDRFFMRISLGYPTAEEEACLLRQMEDEHRANLKPVAEGREILALQKALAYIHVAPDIAAYIVGIVSRTRQNPHARLGASPRASIALYRAARAWAFYQGRRFVLPDDVLYMSTHVLGHRVIANQAARAKGLCGVQIVREAVNTMPIPAIRPA